MIKRPNLFEAKYTVCPGLKALDQRVGTFCNCKHKQKARRPGINKNEKEVIQRPLSREQERVVDF